MPVAAWMAIGGFIATCGWTVLWFMFRRQIARTDDLARHMFEPGGKLAIVQESIGRCVTQEDIDVNIKPIVSQLQRLFDEGKEREGRLIDAIQGNRTEYRAGLGTLQSSIGSLGSRIDLLYVGNAAAK